MLRHRNTVASSVRQAMRSSRVLRPIGIGAVDTSMVSSRQNSYPQTLPLHTDTTQRPLRLSSLCVRYYSAAATPQPQHQGSSSDPAPSPSSASASDASHFAIAKPFGAIPSPKKIPLIGMSRDILEFSPSQTVHAIKRRVDELGKIFREKMFPGLPEFLFVLDPEDVAKVFRADGKHPRRFPIKEWTDVKKELNIPIGLFLSDGEQWERQRKPISKFMMVPRKLGEYHEAFNEVALDLVDLLRWERQKENNLYLDVPAVLNRWSFESVSVFVLGKRLGCLEQKVPADCKMFMSELQNFIAVSQDLLFNLPFHKFVTTKNWKTLSHSQKCVYDVAMHHIREKVAQVTEKDKKMIEDGEDDEPPVGVDFITFMMHAGKMDLDTIATNAVDLMAAGVDTTSNTLSWMLYCLATNPAVQEKLRNEVDKVVGSDHLITPQHIARMPYLHDCIRETQRFYPIAPNNSRILNENVVLSGYQVPAGTHIVMPIRVSGTLPDNFPDPEEFKPERWSRKNKDTANVFGSLPFGFGVRMCVGRRVAELEMHIALAQLIRNFQIEYRDEQPLNFVQKLFIYPQRRMDLAFVDRK